MTRDMRNWKRPFTATQRGFLFLGVIVLLITSATITWRSCTPPEPTILSEAEKAELERFRQERLQAEASYRQRQQAKFRKSEGIQDAQLFVFDPNTADSATLIRLGLAPWQARNILKYRRKGGRWRTPESFARLYGLSHEDFLRLRPYIQIMPTDEERRWASERIDTFHRRFPEKIPAGTVIELNLADTNQLKRIPGIGSYYARRICEYREQLGAFITPDQLHEIKGLPDNIAQWFRISETPHVKKMNVNKATFQELVRHPYLNYDQVKAIFDYRRKYGAPKSWKELRLLPSFRQADTIRMSSYLEF